MIRNERGAIMMLAMAIMLALLFLAAGSSLFTRGDQRLTVNLRDATRVLFIAEAGVEWSQNQMRGGDAALYFDSSATVSPTPQPFAGGSFTVTAGTRDSNGRRAVVSSGAYLGTERAISATMRRFTLDAISASDCFRPGDADTDGVCDSKFGLVSNQTASIRGNSLVDSYRGDSGVVYSVSTAKSHGNIATNGDLTLLGSGTQVRGGVYVGRSLSAGTNTVTQPKVMLPTVYLPPLPSFSSVCSPITNPVLLDCDSQLPIVTGLTGVPPSQTLTVSGGQRVCMAPGTYCFRQVVVSSGGTLRFVDAPSASVLTFAVVIQLEGVSGSPAFNVLGRLDYGTGVKPNFFEILSRGDIFIDGWSGANVYGLVYAPRSAVTVNANSTGSSLTFFGRIAADLVTLGGGPVFFHVDEDGRFGSFCTDGSDPTCSPAFVIRDEWRENRG